MTLSIELSASEVVEVSLCSGAGSFVALAVFFVSPSGSLRSDDEEAAFSARFFAASIISFALF